MSDNLVVNVLEAARRHPDDLAIQSMVTSLERARATARSRKRTESLDGWHRAIEGSPGHAMMYDVDASILGSMIQQASSIHAVVVIAECLAAALRALGETIDH